MQRLLCIVGKMDTGGAETFLMKLYRKLDRNVYQMDFCVSSTDKGFYEDEIILMGGKIYRITPKTINFFKYMKELKRVIKDSRYDRVLRIGADCFCTLDLWIAFFCGVKVRAFRSSNSNTVQKPFINIIHKLLRVPLNSVANVKFAPSDLAANFTFGSRCVKKGKVIFLNNAIDYNIYKYNQEKRFKIRHELNLNDEFIIGHIGRFNQQKNHMFLINVFNELCKTNNNIKLLLVGKGELENQIIEKAIEYNIMDKIIMLGVRSDIPDILSAMDLFVFPSFFEGMPNVVIEAQASGLKCILSDRITKKVNITEFVQFLPLNDIDKWVKLIESIIHNKESRPDCFNKFLENKYTIDQTLQIFVNEIYNRK